MCIRLDATVAQKVYIMVTALPHARITRLGHLISGLESVRFIQYLGGRREAE